MSREASTPRYAITPSGDMWRVRDNKTDMPSARVYTKARAQRLADAGNTRAVADMWAFCQNRNIDYDELGFC